MGFDRLPSYNLNIPEFRPHVAPAPPVSQVPSAVAEAVAKILGQVMETTNPTARKKKKLENAILDRKLSLLEGGGSATELTPLQQQALVNAKLTEQQKRQDLSKTVPEVTPLRPYLPPNQSAPPPPEAPPLIRRYE